jgi:hypothetical protein
LIAVDGSDGWAARLLLGRVLKERIPLGWAGIDVGKGSSLDLPDR